MKVEEAPSGPSTSGVGFGGTTAWLVEWTVAGAVLGLAPFAALFATAVLLNGPPPTISSQLVAIVVSAALAGGAVGAAGALPARALAARLARLHPAAPWLLGPVIGAVGGVAVAVSVLWWRTGGGDERAVLITVAFGGGAGGITITPAWVTYVVLRARGRPGWPALGVALTWGPIAFLVAAVGADLALG